jgi:hypothetical protein
MGDALSPRAPYGFGEDGRLVVPSFSGIFYYFNLKHSLFTVVEYKRSVYVVMNRKDKNLS